MNSSNPNKFLSSFGRLCGAVGLVLLISSPLTWMLTSQIGALVLGKLIIGTLMIGFYVSTNADIFVRLAGSRSTGLLAMSSATLVLVLGLVGAANYLAYKHPKEFDLTKEGLYTLSEQTTGLLSRLTQPVHVLTFYSNLDPTLPQVTDILQRYANHSNKLTFDSVDPQSRPDLVEKYQITDRGPRIVVISNGQEARVKEPSEQELTYALIRVTEQTAKKVYFLTGHGEPDIGQAEEAEGLKKLADAIIAEGYHVQTLDLQNLNGTGPLGAKINLQEAQDASPALHIPDDVGMLIIAGVKRPLQTPEVDAVSEYLDRGGRVLLFLDPHTKTGLKPLLSKWNIEAHNDIIVDTNPLNRLLGLGPAAPMIAPAAGEHAITADLRAPIVMVTALSLEITQTQKQVQTQALARTGTSAWGETQVGADGSAAHDDDDYAPPLTVAIAAHTDTSKVTNKLAEEGRLVVFGDTDFISNRYLNMQGNQDFALNALHWTVQQEQKISIRPKTRSSSQLFLSGDQLARLKFFSMDMLPVVIVAMGLGIVLIRRQR